MKDRILPLIFMGALSACGQMNPLPASFNGEWDLNPAACADLDGVTRLSIRDSKLQFYESGGTVLSTRSSDAGSTLAEIDWWDVNDTDADERPIVRRRQGKLTLSPDQSGLNIEMFDKIIAYVRCR